MFLMIYFSNLAEDTYFSTGRIICISNILPSLHNGVLFFLPQPLAQKYPHRAVAALGIHP